MKVKKYIGFLGISLLFCLIMACDDKNERPENIDPLIVSVSPKTASEGAIITILGRNLSPKQEDNIVKFNGTEAIVLEASAGELKVIVPDGGSTGNLTINVLGKELIGGVFTYETPGVEYLVKTLAGGSAAGLIDGIGGDALFNNPEGVVIDGEGNIIVSDRTNNAIRKITPSGEVSTLAGNGNKGYVDGPVATAQFNFPWKSAIDSKGNIYVAERDNDRIRKITPEGMVSTVAGSERGFANGKGTEAKFNQPLDVAVDLLGNLYVADNINHNIRKITTDGVVSTFAGSTKGFADGKGEAAQFNNPSGLEVDKEGNVYVADRANHRIRKITPNGDVTTIAGTGSAGNVNGNALESKFNQPYGIALTKEGELIIADLVNNSIRKIDSDGQVSTIAGTVSGYADGAGRTAKFNQPTDVAVSSDGTIYVSDLGNRRIRKITLIDN